jgi:adenylate kinase
MRAKPAPRAIRIVLLGPPGSGKGTQAALIARRLDVPAVSTGDLLRRAVAQGSPIGRRVADVVARGGLVDDATMRDLVRARLAEGDARHGVVLDGYPRTVRQAEDLDAILAAAGHRLDAVVLMRVPEATLVERMGGRRRGDDRPDVIRQRLRVYGETTAPLVEHYRRRHLLHEVDGNRAIDTVAADVLVAVACVAP